MSLPRNDAQALRRYGTELMPFISHWRTRLVKGCTQDSSFHPMIQPLQSDLLETQVFVEVCRCLDVALERQAALSVEAVSRHTLVAMIAELCERGFKQQVTNLVDKLSPA